MNAPNSPNRAGAGDPDPHPPPRDHADHDRQERDRDVHAEQQHGLVVLTKLLDGEVFQRRRSAVNERAADGDDGRGLRPHEGGDEVRHADGDRRGQESGEAAGEQSPAAPLSAGSGAARPGAPVVVVVMRGRVVVVVIVAGREERAGRTSRRLLPLGGLLPLSRPLPLVIPGRTLLWGACCQAREATVTVGVAVPWPVAGPRVLIRRVLIGRVLIGLVTLRVLVRRMAVLVLGERRVARRMPVTRRVLVTHTPIDGARPPPRSEIALTVSTR